MKNRPLSVTIIGWLFIVLGVITFLAGLQPFIKIITEGDIPSLTSHEILDLALASITRLLAIIAGTFVLYGFNWARWLLVIWMGFHIVISFQGTLWIIIFHCVIFGSITYFLFRPAVSTWFKTRKKAPI